MTMAVKIVILGEGKFYNVTINQTCAVLSAGPKFKQLFILTYSLVVIARVGKTSLLKRYVKNEFDGSQVSTIDATYLEKKINVGQQSMKLSIWDTAGQERYHALNAVYYRGSAGALIVYDVTDNDSFIKVKTWS